MPTCADVETDKVYIVIGQYLCASAAVCGGNLLTAAISMLSIRDQEVPSSNLGAPTNLPIVVAIGQAGKPQKHLAVFGRNFAHHSTPANR